QGNLRQAQAQVRPLGDLRPLHALLRHALLRRGDQVRRPAHLDRRARSPDVGIPGGLKMTLRMGLINKKPDWTTERFRAYWKESHSNLASQLPGLVQYHQNHVVDTAQRGISHKRGPETLDGISQLWFEGAAGMDQAFSGTLSQRLIDD